MSPSRRPAISCLTLLLAAAQAASGEYADPSGFALTYPDGWAAFARGDVKAGTIRLPPAVAAAGFDIDSVSVLVVRPGENIYSENLTVVVTEGKRVTPTEAAAAKMAGVLADRMAAAGMSVLDVRGRVERVGTRDAVVVDCVVADPRGQDARVRSRQVLFEGDGRTFVVTCTAAAATFDQHAPAFDGMLASFRCPAPEARKASGWNWGRAAILYAAAGGLIGAAGGGLWRLGVWLARRRTARPPD